MQYIPRALGEFYGNPVYWNNTVYFLAHLDYLKAYALTKGALSTTPIAQTSKLRRRISVDFGEWKQERNCMGGARHEGTRNSRHMRRAVCCFTTPAWQRAEETRWEPLGTGHADRGEWESLRGDTDSVRRLWAFPAVDPASGNNQSGSAGTTLPIPITVVASNPYTGSPIPGVTVTFSDGGKKGTFGSPTAVTDSNGLASSTYTLPNLPQTVTITVTSAGYASASFAEQGKVGPVASLSSCRGPNKSERSEQRFLCR